MKDIITKFAAPFNPGNISGGSATGSNADLGGAIINVLNGVLGVLAAVAVVVIVIGGINYMTSTGDAAKVKKAKDTILYAVIGLVVCGLAAIIVNFVVKKIIGNI